jgi:hypothetical protein
MKTTGTLFLSRSHPLVQKNAKGEFMLTLCTVNRIAPKQTEAWRLVWTGPNAETFYTEHKAALTPGAVLQVEATDVRTHTITIGQTELTATVCSIEFEQQREAA